ncbi:hypothetical protein C8F04DRAFT_1181355 [Mycena alexandri]|uniref:Uncharacterized protein n=1 Tax=Mycena alexandri TaxID=1745969 RepID=A0AAD6X2B7_9AGAR|nr:hypothetical protein C8F04DRAFT_1181355 [Mycena alexandri]
MALAFEDYVLASVPILPLFDKCILLRAHTDDLGTAPNPGASKSFRKNLANKGVNLRFETYMVVKFSLPGRSFATRSRECPHFFWVTAGGRVFFEKRPYDCHDKANESGEYSQPVPVSPPAVENFQTSAVATGGHSPGGESTSVQQLCYAQLSQRRPTAYPKAGWQPSKSSTSECRWGGSSLQDGDLGNGMRFLVEFCPDVELQEERSIQHHFESTSPKSTGAMGVRLFGNHPGRPPNANPGQMELMYTTQ